MRPSTSLFALEVVLCGVGASPFILGVLDVLERSVVGTTAIVELVWRFQLETSGHAVLLAGVLLGGVLWAPLVVRARWSRGLPRQRRRQLRRALIVGALGTVAAVALWFVAMAARCDGCGCGANSLVNTWPADAIFALAALLLASTRVGVAGVVRAVEDDGRVGSSTA